MGAKDDGFILTNMAKAELERVRLDMKVNKNQIIEKQKESADITFNEVNRLVDFLYDIANKIVGSVGESTKTEYSATGEDYIEFATCFTNMNEALQKWIDWICAYKSFAKYIFSGKIRSDDQPLIIYWGQPPEIKQDEKNPNRYALYARLIVTNEKKVKLLHNPQFGP